MKKKVLSVSILSIFLMMSIAACSGISMDVSKLDTLMPKVQAQPTQAATVPTRIPLPSGANGDLLAAYEGTLENIYAAVSPSVVNIQVVQKVAASDSPLGQFQGMPFFNTPQGQQPQEQYQSALGSGFVWDQQGHIVTNNHVVNGADKIQVKFSDGTILAAQLVGADPDSDLAVLKVDLPADQLHPIALADSDSVHVGQLAIAIGNPFGLQGTMTTGIISAMGRSLPADENNARSYSIPDIIQTDAPINPGNSGGVLVDAQGQMVGVTSAIESPVRANAGIGFAIPSNIVNKVVPVLIQDGKYVHSWLGISGATLIPEFATAMNLDANQHGALVEEVSPNSPAEKAGLQGSTQQVTIDGQNVNVGGDVITAIDSQPVVEMNDLISYLAGKTTPGQVVSLTILRDGKEQSVDVTLAPRPGAQETAAETNPPASSDRGIHLGIAATTVTDAIANEMNLPNGQQGVLVEQVEPGSLADKAGLRGGSDSANLDGQQVMVGGDVITAINGYAITSVQELKAALAQLASNQPLTLTVLRNGETVEVTVNPGG